MITVDDLIRLYGFEPLPVEGGFFKQTYRAAETIPVSAMPERYSRDKPFGTAILYLLTPDEDSFSAMHWLLTDEIYHFYLGDPVEMLLLYPDRRSERVILGQDVLNGQKVQFVVPRGVWMGSHLLPGGRFALIGTTMAPGFTPDEYVGGEREALIAQYPWEAELIARLTRPGAPRSKGTEGTGGTQVSSPASTLRKETHAMEPVDILIQNGLIVTMDAAERIIEDGALAISGSQIVGVGPSAEFGVRFRAARTIDARGKIVMPGLINAHTHVPDTLFRGLVEDLPLEAWLERLWVSERAFLRPDTVRLGARLGYAEMIRSGTTTALDMFWFPEELVAVAREAGFRVMTGPIFFDFEGPDAMPIERRLEQGRALLEQMQGDPLVVPCVLPHSTYTVSPENLQRAQALADNFGAFLSTHVSETRTEVRTVRERYQASPPRHLDRLGLLTERAVLAHCVHLADDEIDLVARRGAAIAHCPVSNLKLGSGIMPLPKMRRAGARLALGTDGPVSSNDLDLWIAMRFAATLHRGVHEDPTVTSAREVVRMVTCDAARALGLGDRIGSLEVGKLADVIVIDLDVPHLVPLYDVYAHLVYTVGRQDVTTTIIHGRIVMQDRRLLTIDEEAAVAATRELAQAIWAGSR